AWAQTASEAYEAGKHLAQTGKLQEAVASFDLAIRLKPDFAQAYSARGNVHNALGQFEQAGKDYNEAIRLNPRYVEAYYNRGNVYSDAGQYEQALKDYNEAIRLSPRYAEAYYNRGLAHLMLGRGEAAADARAYLNLKGWRDEQALYIVLIGHFGDRLAQRSAEARQILDEAAAKADPAAWPYPIIRFLRREIKANALLEIAKGVDKQTEALTYLGLDFARAGQGKYALPYLQWVKKNGNKRFVEYRFALAELARLGATNPALPKPASAVQFQPAAPVQQ
ncbi:MAG: tetratricopeptide repeat protein, partial [Candidatus Binatia bacterium]